MSRNDHGHEELERESKRTEVYIYIDTAYDLKKS